MHPLFHRPPQWLPQANASLHENDGGSRRHPNFVCHHLHHCFPLFVIILLSSISLKLSWNSSVFHDRILTKAPPRPSERSLELPQGPENPLNETKDEDILKPGISTIDSPGKDKRDKIGEDLHKDVCFSPEKNVSWPCDADSCFAKGNQTFTDTVGFSQSSDRTCAFCGQNGLSRYIQKASRQIRNIIDAKCEVLVLSAFLGPQSQNKERRAELSKRVPKSQHCIVIFMLEEDVGDQNDRALELSNQNLREQESDLMTGGAWVIPVPRRLLPYKGMRRNAKLLKLHGHQMFNWHDRFVWFDAKFYIPGDEAFAQFYQDTVESSDACVSFVSLPNERKTMGVSFSRYIKPTFQGYCQHIKELLVRRSQLTDSRKAVEKQCETYLKQLNQTDHDRKSHLYINSLRGHPGKAFNRFRRDEQRKRPVFMESSKLDDSLVDTAIIVWRTGPPRCRQFLADFSCTWADNIQCFSDLDRLSLPFALHEMNLTVSHGNGVTNDILMKNEKNETMVHIVKNKCHWFYGPSFDCTDSETLLDA